MGMISARSRMLPTGVTLFVVGLGLTVGAPAPGSPPPSGLRGAVRERTPDGLIRVSYPVGDLTQGCRAGGRQLVRLVTNSVDQGSWQEAGGAASVRYDHSLQELVVCQTAKRQVEVARLLESLRNLSKEPARRMPKGPPDPAQ